MSSPSPDLEPPVDQELLDEIRGLDPPEGNDALAALVNLFLDDSSKQLETLREAAAAADLSMASRVAHSLKGSSANIGAAVMARLCHEVEQTASGGDLPTVAALVPAVEEEFARVHSALLEAVSSP